MSALQECRNTVKNRFGTTVEQKCSNAFALRHGRTRPKTPATPSDRWTILELDPGKPRRTDAHIAEEVVSRARQAVTDLLKAAEETNPALAAASLLRRHAIDHSRQDFFDRARDLIVALERASREPTQRTDDNERTIRPTSVDACWLNGAIRSPTQALAALAAADDARVRRVDLPRRLHKEISKTTFVVGAPAYRKSHDTSGEGVIVAVIDTEIHLGHPSMAGRVVQQRNYTSEDWANPSGTHPQAPHGTAIAGIIGSAANLLGIAPAITLYNYKVFPTDETLPPGDDFDGALALEQAVQDGVHIANCSWKAIVDDEIVMNGQSREAVACNNAWASGVVVVTSMGNEGPTPGSLTTPADADGVIAVGATDRAGASVPSYSGRGPTATGLQRPHLVAPGGLLADPVISCTIFNNFFAGYTGTSFAAAHVSGLAALLLSQNPALKPDDVRAALLGMCTQLPGVDPNAQGSGLIRVG